MPASFPRRVLFVAAVAVLALLAWRLQELFVIVFGAILAAVVLRAMAGGLERRAHVPPRVSVLVTVVGLLALLVAIGFLVGRPVAEQYEQLRSQLPDALRRFTEWLGTHPIGSQLLQLWENASGDGLPWGRLATYATLTLGLVGSTALMAVMAIYLAADPRTYHRGLLRLLPPGVRGRADDALRAAADGLRGWLKGQAISMLFIGVTTWIGLLLLGAPLALVLGLINGLFAFVPYFGAIVGGLLAVLVAFVEGPRAALHVAVLVFAIQQAEGYVVEPLAHRWAVHLPPALSLVAAIVFGVLFGPLGVLLATPLMVVAMILVQRLYVEEALENGTR